jgi:beta-glucosidase
LNRDFGWGVATSAFQIEGARHEGGKGESIWDRFSDLGRLRDPGDIATDHYHRLEEDLDLLAALDIDAYRFSTAWTRVIPDGTGEVNEEGLDFYRRLVDGLGAREIEPCLTLYHWDLPQALQDQGGWASRQTIDAFARYARVIAETLGDDVGRWITHNEPWVATFLGHLEGVFAPGIQDWPTALTTAHHILVSHGRAAEEIRDAVPEASVGIALDCRPSQPADEDAVEANRRFDGFRNRWFFDPVFGLGYPDDMVEEYQAHGWLPPGLVVDGDMEYIARPLDFLGINYYTTVTIPRDIEYSEPTEGAVGADPDPDHTEMGWLIDPRGFEDFLVRVGETYRPKSILITENGASYSDRSDADGRVHDRRRIDYLDDHIDAVMSARSRGAPVDGYFVWSFLDNLEWLHGFSQRFGLVWVDSETRERTPKDSYYWYRDRIGRD